MTYYGPPYKGATLLPSGVRDSQRPSQCTLGASVPSFIVVAKLTALDPLLTTQITEILHTAMTIRITVMVRWEPTALIELLLVVTPLKPRIIVHSTLVSILIAMVISLKQEPVPSFISSMPAVITSVFLLHFVMSTTIKFNIT
jgi:hypothetical protein